MPDDKSPLNIKPLFNLILKIKQYDTNTYRDKLAFEKKTCVCVCKGRAVHNFALHTHNINTTFT